MAHKYTYPVVDRELQNFFIFVLMLLAVVMVAAAIGSVSGVDTAAVSDVSASGIQLFLDAYAER